MKLVELLRQSEGKTLEFKRDLVSPHGLLRTVVAFANTAGGAILIGVEDRTKHVHGISDPLALEERVANLISDSIKPRLVPDIQVLHHRNAQIVAVEVFPSPARPHYLAREGLPRGAYVRVGSTNRSADGPLIAEMRRFSSGDSFDETPLPGLDADALDFEAASRAFSSVRDLGRRDLETLRLLTRHQGRLTPTNGGVLLFGNDRLAHFPDAWVQAARFAGHDRTTILDQADIRTPLVQAVHDAIAFVRKHAFRGIVIDDVEHREHWTVPLAAIREAAVNAVAHADYSQRGAPLRLAIFDDRIEVENPGLLPFGLTLDDLPLGVSKLRNRTIGRVFHELGLVEQWGSGVQRMLATCRDAGLPPPRWEEIGLRLRVTIPTKGDGTVAADATDERILELLRGGGEHRTPEIAEAIGRSTRTARTRLARLVERGLVHEVATGPHDPGKTYVANGARRTGE